MPTAAIYARKSVLNEKSESIENQIKRGKEFAKNKGWNTIIYKDEGYSGKDTSRPGFESMMKDAEEGKFQYLICYRLDRVSRNVADFSSLIEELNELGIGFISISENFDTTTPMGRAMMMIASVFAQLERETIAERVKDNMLDKAKSGSWTGGPVNFGFDVEKVTVMENGKQKEISKLVINEKESEIVKEFFDWYLQPGGSIRNNVITANKKGYKTKNGSLWNQNQMGRLLRNPKYCIATPEVYDYFINETEITVVNNRDEFDGKHALQYYNRRKPYKNTTRLRNQKEWIVAISDHKGIIPGNKWVETQRKLNKRANKHPRKGTGKRGLLAYLVKCGKCGSSMAYYLNKKNSNDYDYAYYKCRRRVSQGKHLCDNNTVRAHRLEEAVIKKVKQICSDKNFIEKTIEKTKKEINKKREPLLKERQKISKQIDNINIEIKRLIRALGKGSIPEDLIEERIKELNREKSDLTDRLEKIEADIGFTSTDSINADIFKEYAVKFNNTFNDLNLEEKRRFLQSLIKEIRVTDDRVDIYMHFIPQSSDNSEFLSRTDTGSLK